MIFIYAKKHENPTEQILSNLIYKIMQYQICEASHEAKA